MLVRALARLLCRNNCGCWGGKKIYQKGGCRLEEEQKKNELSIGSHVEKNDDSRDSRGGKRDKKLNGKWNPHRRGKSPER